MASVTINGKSYSGGSIVIRGDTVVIDGVPQGDGLTGVVEVRVVEGVLGHLETDSSVSCGEVRGNVSAGGSVSCAGVGGSVQAGGSMRADDVAGAVFAGGSISKR